jgi:hypothetical protein
MSLKTHSTRNCLCRATVLLALVAIVILASTRLRADTGTCDGATTTLPFTDVMGNPFFCQIASAYFSGLTNGTTATTYSPTQTVTREQMAAFITRTQDQSLKRGSKKAVTEKWWTPQDADSLTLTNVGDGPRQVKFDGTDLWVANNGDSSVMRIRPSDGKLLDTWTGATSAHGIVCAMGKIFITGRTNTGRLYMIDPTQPAGAVTTVSSSLGSRPEGIAFDGSRLWTANDGSVSVVSLTPTTVHTVSIGFGDLDGILYDGSNMWVTDTGDATIKKLQAGAMIVQTINVGSFPQYPVFDGTNIWVPNFASDSVIVVRVKDAGGNALATAFVLATLTGNGLNEPITVAFDGERILVTNNNISTAAGSVSLWKAADLTPLGSFPTGNFTTPVGACSDGLNFWITLNGNLARF